MAEAPSSTESPANRTDFTPDQPTATCQEREDKKIAYCEPCSELICGECVARFHKGHDYKLVEDVYLPYKEDITTGLVPLKEQQQEVQQVLARYDAKEQDINKQKDEIKASITQMVDKLKRQLDQRKEALIESLESVTRRKLKELATQRNSVESIHAEMSSCVENAEGVLEAGMACKVVAMKKPMLKQVNQITTYFNSRRNTIHPQTEADIELLTTDIACQAFGEITCDPVSAKNSFVTGYGTSFAVANKPTSVELHLVTAQDIKSSDTTSVSADLEHTKSRVSVRCEVRHENGQCRINYKPVIRGKHGLHIRIHGEHIQGSPYAIAVAPSEESLSRASNVIRGLKKPSGITTNSSRQVIMVERSTQRISVFTLGGDNQFNFGERGKSNGQFNCPQNVAADLDDNIYVTDKKNHRIQKFTSEGKFVAAVGSQGNSDLQFNFPNGIALDNVMHNLYVCDQLNHRIQVITTDLKFVRSFGTEGEGQGQFKSPMCICFDEANNLYVTDSGNNRVQVFTDKGCFIRSFSNKGDKVDSEILQQPFAIAIDSSNVVYVSEWEKNTISLFTAEGPYLMTFGTNGSEGEINIIRGMHIDQNDSIYVCDQKNNRVLIF